MGFLFRVLFIVGIIYLISPARPALPEWLANPAASSSTLTSAAATAAVTAAPTVVAALNSQPVQTAVQSLSKSANNATQSASASPAQSVSQRIASALSSEDTDPLAALIRDTVGVTPARSTPSTVAVADQPTAPAPIPLPPRREPSDASAKKI